MMLCMRLKRTAHHHVCIRIRSMTAHMLTLSPHASPCSRNVAMQEAVQVADHTQELVRSLLEWQIGSRSRARNTPPVPLPSLHQSV